MSSDLNSQNFGTAGAMKRSDAELLIQLRLVTIVSLIFALLSLSALLFFTQKGFEYDDSYIFYRYIDKFVSGHGLVFNNYEKYEGFSSFSWVLLVSFFKYIFHCNTMMLSKIIGLGSYAFAILLAGVAVFLGLRNSRFRELPRLLVIIYMAVFLI